MRWITTPRNDSFSLNYSFWSALSSLKYNCRNWGYWLLFFIIISYVERDYTEDQADAGEEDQQYDQIVIAAEPSGEGDRGELGWGRAEEK